MRRNSLDGGVCNSISASNNEYAIMIHSMQYTVKNNQDLGEKFASEECHIVIFSCAQLYSDSERHLWHMLATFSCID